MLSNVFVVLYCNFTSLAFLGLIGFLNKAAKSFIFSYPSECSQDVCREGRGSRDCERV